MAISSFNLSEQTNTKDFEKHIITEMNFAVEMFERELSKLRTNRAHPSLVEDTRVEVYGQVMLLKNLAVITAPDSSTLAIQPFDVSQIHEIEKSLVQQCNLGSQPRNDGSVIKISLPPISQARRLEMVKILHKKCEEAIVALRKVRQDAINYVKDQEKSKKVSEDLSQRLQKAVQSALDFVTKTLETMAQKKEKALNE